MATWLVDLAPAKDMNEEPLNQYGTGFKFVHFAPMLMI
ncbi:MAG: hypothetical protein ACJAYG_001941 [Oceanicoccus sp.]|jgi:hypothetical protein